MSIKLSQAETNEIQSFLNTEETISSTIAFLTSKRDSKRIQSFLNQDIFKSHPKLLGDIIRQNVDVYNLLSNDMKNDPNIAFHYADSMLTDPKNATQTMKVIGYADFNVG